jgi:TonB family protein
MVVRTDRCVVLLLGMAAMLGLNSTVSPASALSQNSSGGTEVTLTKLAPPVYPPIARAARVSGEVALTVIVRQNGSVESVRVDSGPPMLHQATIDSAWHSEFQCNECNAASGTYKLSYVFRLTNTDSCCDASDHPAAPDQRLDSSRHHVIVEAPVTCICDPAAELTRRVRSLKCLWLWRCSNRTA